MVSRCSSVRSCLMAERCASFICAQTGSSTRRFGAVEILAHCSALKRARAGAFCRFRRFGMGSLSCSAASCGLRLVVRGGLDRVLLEEARLERVGALEQAHRLGVLL